MQRTMLGSKINGIKVTKKNKNYSGSITLPSKLMEEADILEYEQVHVVDVTNGQRFVTYAIAGWADEVCVNGAAARKVEVGDKLIVLSYLQVSFNQHPEDWAPVES